MANLVGERWARLSVQQKFSATILGICGFMTLVLSFAQIRSQILAPFFVQRRVLDRSNAFFAKQDAEAKKIELLRQKDTDGDGISDYDELYVYRTSPYLTDTDGDAIPDGEEVARGIDPNCPEGKTCNDAQALVGDATSSTLAGLGVTAPPTAASSTRNPAVLAGLRTYLAGKNILPQEQLEQIPDELLVQVYGTVYEQELRAGSASSSAPSAPRSSTSTF